MRAIWKGAVSFGLVSVPVKLYAATESHDVSFRQVHAKDGGRIKYQRVCSLDGEEVAYADIAKGYEPEGAGAKPYALLRQALKDADRMAVVTVALRQRTTIAVLRVRETEAGEVIVLQTMMWPDEVRVPDFKVDGGDAKPAEVKMANMLVETLAGD